MSNKTILGCPKCGSTHLTLSRVEQVEYSIDNIDDEGLVDYDVTARDYVGCQDDSVSCDSCGYYGGSMDFVFRAFKATVTVEIPLSAEEEKSWRETRQQMDRGRRVSPQEVHWGDGKVSNISISKNPRSEKGHR